MFDTRWKREAAALSPRVREVWEAVVRLPPLLLAGLATVAHALIYGAANRFPLGEPRLLPLTAVDREVPFLPESVWLYFSAYLLVFLAFVACREVQARGRFLIGFFVVVLASTAVHWLMPVAYPRALFAASPSTDALSALGLSVLYALDSPSSCFPSLHVGTASLSVLAAWEHAGRRRALFAFWAAGIAISTLTLKQHYAIDVVGGVAMALLVHHALRGLDAGVAGSRRLAATDARSSPA